MRTGAATGGRSAAGAVPSPIAAGGTVHQQGQDVTAAGLEAATAVARLRAGLTAAGHEPRQTNPRQLLVARSHRPRWTIVVSVLLFPVGLLALLVRDTRACRLEVFDGPTGARVHLTGPLAPALVDDVRTALATSGARPERTAPPQRPEAMITATPRSGRAAPATAGAPAAEDHTVSATAPPAPPEAPAAAPTNGARPPEAPAGRPADGALPPPAMQSAAPEGHTLVLRASTGQQVPLRAGGAVVVGRDPTTDAGQLALAVPDDVRSVSKTHATIGVEGDGRVWCNDQHSTNGTRLRTADGDEAPVPPGSRTEVPVGAALLLGDIEIEFER